MHTSQRLFPPSLKDGHQGERLPRSKPHSKSAHPFHCWRCCEAKWDSMKQEAVAISCRTMTGLRCVFNDREPVPGTFLRGPGCRLLQSCNRVRGLHVRRHWRHKAPHKRNRGSRETWSSGPLLPSSPSKCPGSLAPWTPPDCPLVLVTWVQVQGPCLGGLLNVGRRLLALFLGIFGSKYGIFKLDL
jgi:hypothetical protein